jgi:hypothetical protein
MKFTAFTIILFFIFAFKDKHDLFHDNAISFFPASKTDIIKAGFHLEKGAIKEHYKKIYGDTTVFIHYPDEESKYYKLILFNFDKIDTASFFNFVKQNQSPVKPDNILLTDENGNERAFFLNIDKRKRFAHLLYVHPDYKKYSEKIKTVPAPEAIDN